MDIKRQLAVALVGAGVGLTGCQSSPLGGLAFWNKKNDSAALATASPDASKQRFDGLSKQYAGGQQGAQQAKSGTAALGGQKPAANDNFLVASWKKTSAAVTGTLAPNAKSEESTADPLRLDSPAKKMGPEVHVAAARMLENQGKVPEAEAQYQKALQAVPTDLNALVGLARLHDRQGNGRQAIELYQKAITANPTSSLAYNDLGLCLARQQQPEPALQALHKAAELQPNNPKYRNNLATVLVDTGRTEEAYKQLTAGSTPAVAHYNIGYLLQQKGQSAAALQHYQQALAFDPNLGPAREMISQLSGSQAQPVAMQPGPRANTLPMAAQTAAEPTPPTTQRLSYEESVEPKGADTKSYAEGSTTFPVSTTAPKVVAARAPKDPNSFHIGDDEPIAEVSSLQRQWDADWPLIGGHSAAGSVHPLPKAE